MKIDSISIIQNISKFISISFLTISCVITLLLLYILFGGSLAGEIEIRSFINDVNKINKYDNFNTVPFSFKLTKVVFIVTILFLINTILRYWDNFMSLVKKGKYFEINTIKNLKYISYILSSIWIVLFLIETFTQKTIIRTYVSFQQHLNDKIIDENIFNENIDLGFNFPPLIFLIIPTILWVISHILIEGIKLKKENELTI
tara:strand:- start:3896 stop:4501 length:606 start_codon:yes stop_codon:yes gene_type:complete